jgi:hypothetical protein
MSLNPSNALSQRITGRTPFPNVAGLGKTEPERVDAILSSELKAAGIEAASCEILRPVSGEPCTAITGKLHQWGFRRAWYYWVAEGPGLPLADAMALHAEHGTSVRVEGDCGCPSPLEYRHGFAVGMYHVDNAEGLAALASTIRSVWQRAENT